MQWKLVSGVAKRVLLCIDRYMVGFRRCDTELNNLVD